MKECFWPDQDLSKGVTGGGHWTQRRNVEVKPFTKMFHRVHAFWMEGQDFGPKAVYIFRDGRDVAVSYWHVKAMQNRKWYRLSFSEFLRQELDWFVSPGNRNNKGLFDGSIVKHWLTHVDSWQHAHGVQLVCYEELVLHPERVMADIARYLGIDEWEYRPLEGLVGVWPNKGVPGQWRDTFSQDDLDFFFSIVPEDHWALWRDHA